MPTLRINYFPWSSLRFHDQPILLPSTPTDYLLNVTAVYQSTTRTFKFQRFSGLQQKFHYECIQDLKQTLQSHNSDLMVVDLASLEPFLESLKKQFNLTEIHTMTQYCSEEVSIVNLLKRYGEVKLSEFNTLIDVTKFNSKSTYTVFRNRVEKTDAKVAFREPVKTPTTFAKWPKINGEWDVLEKWSSTFDINLMTAVNTSFPFKGGETSARERVQEYLFKTNSVATYKETRNSLQGSNYSTKFSPFLAYGCISATNILEQLHLYEKTVTKNESTYCVFFELLWRDYFVLVSRDYGTKLFTIYGLSGKNIEWKQDGFAQWQSGNTGIPFIDANMRELNTTGFMSNRGRQNVASFLTKDIQVDWRMGAEHYESKLLDFDPASNYGNWQYVAGVGNDPRTYRHFNVVKQSVDYDPNGDYIKKWCPELKNVPAPYIFSPWKMPMNEQTLYGCIIGKDYPEPILTSPHWDKYVKVSNRATKRTEKPAKIPEMFAKMRKTV